MHSFDSKLSYIWEISKKMHFNRDNFIENVHLGMYIIGINHGFECINIRRVPRKVFEHEAEG